MKKLFFFFLCIVLWGCSDKKEQNLEEISPEASTVNPLFKVVAQEKTRIGSYYSFYDEEWRHITNQLPVLINTLDFVMYEDGTIKGNRRRVQNGFVKGELVDSVVYSDDFTGSWNQRERLTSKGKQIVYEIIPDNFNDVWYLPEDHRYIYAQSGDNYKDMINQMNSSFIIKTFIKK